jgi:MFS family permease
VTQPTQAAPAAEQEHELFMLAGIAGFFHWLEEFLVILSGPFLTFGLGIGLVDLLSDGALFVNAPALLYVWAIAQTVGVDGQMVVTWARVGRAFRRRAWGTVFGFSILGLLLAYVGFVAALVFAYQQAYHLTTARALAKLGFDTVSWLWQRTAVSVGLVCLSGLLRYQKPRPAVVDVEAELQRIENERRIQAAKAQAQGDRLRGLAGVARGVVQAAGGKGSSASAPPLPSRNGSKSA